MKQILNHKLHFIMFILLILLPILCAGNIIYWAGDGGQGITISVLELNGVGLSRDEQHLLLLTQSSLISTLQRYSAMTVFDQQYIENILNQQRSSLGGNFSDENYIRIGELINSQLLVFGTITKLGNNFMLELAVTNTQTGERVASYTPRQASLQSLRDFSAVRKASIDILEQLGIRLTEVALSELGHAEYDVNLISGIEAMSLGSVAERRGNQLEAATYFYQAASFTPANRDAINRVSVISTVAGGSGIDVAVMNRMQEHDAWRDLVTEIKNHYQNVFPYELRYNPNITIDDIKIDFEKRTATFSIPIRLAPTDEWKVIDGWRSGLNRARRGSHWDFNLSSVGPQQITVTLQVVNSSGKVLSTRNHVFDKLSETQISDALVTFTIVDIENMDDITIKVYSINEVPTERSLEMGMSMMRVVPGDINKLSSRRISYSQSMITRMNALTNIQFHEEKLHNGIYKIIDIGLGAPMGFYTHAGLEIGLGLYFDNFTSESLYFNVSPLLGMAFPLGSKASFYTQGLLDVGRFGGEWNGLIAKALTPGFNAGFIFNTVKADGNFAGFGITGLGINYRGTWYENIYTHGISINFSSLELVRN